MKKVLVIGATGNLGHNVVLAGLSLGHEVTAFVRSESKLIDVLGGELPKGLQVIEGDATNPEDVYSALSGKDAAVLTAGYVLDGEGFTRLVDNVITQADNNPQFKKRLWILGGVGLLKIPNTDKIGIGLPTMPPAYDAHKVNYDRIQQTNLDWSVMCPGPMIHDFKELNPNLRISKECLPLEVPSIVDLSSDQELGDYLLSAIQETVVPYADIAHIIMSNLEKDSEFTQSRVGVALPKGELGTKEGWKLGTKTK